ncbi:MAG: polysaccharide biosynthesis protein [Chloroflexi bacterium]|nr:polysaccharide biosynthesis protein [Chloroflexota bacterium]
MYLTKLRNRHFLLLDGLILCLTPTLAILLRLDRLGVPPMYWQGVMVYTAVSLIVRFIAFYSLGLYQRFWRYASINELTQIANAVFFSSLCVWLLVSVLNAVLAVSLPRSVFVIDTLLVLLFVGGSRFSVRLNAQRRQTKGSGYGRRVLVVGAGNAGSMIVREIQHNPQLDLTPVGFVDDDPDKHNMQILGVPVLGGRQDLPQLIAKYQVNRVIIAMPTAPGKIIREVAAVCEKLGADTKILPGIHEMVEGTVAVKQLRNVAIEDLLRREPIETDIAAVRELVAGRRVMVTGGGGSIGSELCRQVLRFNPQELILLGHGENSIFEIYHELRRITKAEVKITAVIADVRFADRIQAIFDRYRPEIVFHTAAHKHVPLMEMNPAEAITNNVLGTRNLLRAAQSVDVAHFVMISTDKAVNPTSVMGASKRTAELLVHQAARRSGKPYVAVRFGNVLGSRGSVVLTFQKQIAVGGPVTVTDPNMTRFFMTIPEAVQLVLQAAVLGSGGEVFVLDMGEPVKIVDLARDLIQLSGLEIGRDIEIQYTGMRPGEKMYEELFVTGEQYHRTCHEKVFIAGNASSFVPGDLDDSLDGLEASAWRNDAAAIIRGLQNLIPEYEPMTPVTAVREPAPPTKADKPLLLPGETAVRTSVPAR